MELENLAGKRYGGDGRPSIGDEVSHLGEQPGFQTLQSDSRLRFQTDFSEGPPTTQIEELEDLKEAPMLVAHLPDVVVFHDHDRLVPNQQDLRGVMMLTRISGLKELCAEFAGLSDCKTDQLVTTVNDYMSVLIDRIVSFDGDIIRLNADCILSTWLIEGLNDLQEAMVQVIKCALEIQRSNNRYLTPLGIVLEIRVGIAAGSINILCLGDDTQRRYVEMGRAMETVQHAVDRCECSGDVVVSPTAWVHCYNIQAKHEILKDGKHVKLTSLIDNGGLSYKHIRTVPHEEEETMDGPESSQTEHETSADVIEQAGSDNETIFMSDPVDNEPGSSIFPKLECLGRIVSIACNIVSRFFLRIMPIWKPEPEETIPEVKVDMNPRLEDRRRVATYARFNDRSISSLELYLERPALIELTGSRPRQNNVGMRHLTVVVVRAQMTKCTKLVFAAGLQNAFEVISRRCTGFHGSLGRIGCSNNNCTFTVLFGLPGFSTDRKCSDAIGFTKSVYPELKDLSIVSQLTIGVATGPMYCGVVGNGQRCEYIAVGSKVDEAADFIVDHPGSVKFDSDTLHLSNLETFRDDLDDVKAFDYNSDDSV